MNEETKEEPEPDRWVNTDWLLEEEERIPLSVFYEVIAPILRTEPDPAEAVDRDLLVRLFGCEEGCTCKTCEME